ncbi:MAG: hypothetical protein V1859_04750 [archaeon]
MSRQIVTNAWQAESALYDLTEHYKLQLKSGYAGLFAAQIGSDTTEANRKTDEWKIKVGKSTIRFPITARNDSLETLIGLANEYGFTGKEAGIVGTYLDSMQNQALANDEAVRRVAVGVCNRYFDQHSVIGSLTTKMIELGGLGLIIGAATLLALDKEIALRTKGLQRNYNQNLERCYTETLSHLKNCYQQAK